SGTRSRLKGDAYATSYGPARCFPRVPCRTHPESAGTAQAYGGTRIRPARYDCPKLVRPGRNAGTDYALWHSVRHPRCVGASTARRAHGASTGGIDETQAVVG